MGNLNKEKLTGKRIGVYFGTFAPLHAGHIDVINQAKRQNDGVIIVSSGFDNDKGAKINLGLNKRYRYLREQFADDSLVYIAKLDENNITKMPYGWDEWLNKLDICIQESISGDLSDKEITIYLGEEEYQEEFFKRRVMYNTCLMNRDHLQISATMIRQNPLKYWNLIARTFRRHFTKKVLIVGSASGGKTTLVKDLARAYNSPFSLEFAREYQEKQNVRDEELDVWDYIKLLEGQYSQTSSIIDGTSNNGLIIADTNSTVTDVYAQYDVSKPDYDNLIKPIVTRLASQELWDLILVIPPETDYVNDGFRNMNQSDNDFRWEFHNKLMLNLVRNGWEDKIFILNKKSTQFDPEGFRARYEDSKKAISNKLGFDLKNFI